MKLKDVRVVSNREGFIISVEEAGRVVQKVIDEHSAAFKIVDETPTTNWRKIVEDMKKNKLSH